MPLFVHENGRVITQGEECALILVAVRTILLRIKDLQGEPGPNQPWSVEIQDIVKTLGIPCFRDRTIGRHITRMKFSRRTYNNKRSVLFGQFEDLNKELAEALWVGKKPGSVWVEEVPEHLLKEAQGLIQLKEELIMENRKRIVVEQPESDDIKKLREQIKAMEAEATAREVEV